MFYILAIFWFIRTTKSLLFWLYLWQLKEYHLGRFWNHFRTAKGKHLLLNKLIFLKIILALILFYYLFPFSPSFFNLPPLIFNFSILLVFFLYFFESINAFKNLFQKKLKRPVLTKKTIVLISAGLIVQILFLYFLFQDIGIYYLVKFAFGLLVFDISTPIIISALILFSQPLTVLLRNQIIKKAKRKREQFQNLLVIGITGSYGKTSTKEFLTEILSQKYKVLKTKENQNSGIGVSQCVLQELKPEHEIFICEMAAHDKGGIKLLCDIIKPKIGIITGINEQHLATFVSMENLISEEGGKELIESLPADGLAILNEDNLIIQNLKLKIQNYNPKLKNIKFCSTKEKSDLRIEDIKVEQERLSFKVCSADGVFTQFMVNLIGVQNIENILLAIVCARELGMSLEEISQACWKIKPEQGRIKLKKGTVILRGADILDSTYSANPNSVISHLEHLRLWSGKKIIIMPCLIELGKASKEVHKRIGKKIGEVCDLAIITTKERFREIEEEALKNGMKKENILFLENPKSILEKVKAGLAETSSNVILLEGRVGDELKLIFTLR